MTLFEFERLLARALQDELRQSGLHRHRKTDSASLNLQTKAGTKRMTLKEVAVTLYGDGLSFNPIVDVALDLTKADCGEDLIFFVRPSGFDKVEFSETWDPGGLGPFRPVGPMTSSFPPEAGH